MINEKAHALGSKSSVIRELFEYGKKRKKEIGDKNVFDFSIGNPSVPAPQVVTDSLITLLKTTEPTKLHGYTSAAGDPSVRAAIADYLNNTFGAHEDAKNIFLTAGAAASLTISLNAILNASEEVIVFSPFFPEYKVFIEKAGGILRDVTCKAPDFQPDLTAFENSINEKTKAVIINSPNNPTGAVIPETTIEKIAKILENKQKQYGSQIFIIADEPYRELVYSNKKVAYIPLYYKNTLVCYSFSKSLSLPGERIGYIVVGADCENAGDVFFAVCGAARELGFICAPALFQYVIPKCLGKTSNIEIYKQNRETLYNALTKIGYNAVYPDGAFYLFVKALEEDSAAFSERAKKYELLLVPSNDFGCEGYVRIAYCVSPETVENSITAFEKLYNDYAGKN